MGHAVSGVRDVLHCVRLLAAHSSQANVGAAVACSRLARGHGHRGPARGHSEQRSGLRLRVRGEDLASGRANRRALPLCHHLRLHVLRRDLGEQQHGIGDLVHHQRCRSRHSELRHPRDRLRCVELRGEVRARPLHRVREAVDTVPLVVVHPLPCPLPRRRGLHARPRRRHVLHLHARAFRRTPVARQACLLRSLSRVRLWLLRGLVVVAFAQAGAHVVALVRCHSAFGLGLGPFRRPAVLHGPGEAN
mmetsp:Transcript_134090/g.388122  ORF Transcript_134090/g.388122 Transcript_134090/m.388122 type:complete len:248 (+) Transcript_134090:954-1697(+)